MINARRRTILQLLLVAAATVVMLEPLVTIAAGGNAPAWSHWLCSPAALRSAVHTVSGSKGLGSTLLTALELHWPHFLPILLGLATLVYLWRANVQYHSQDGHGGVRSEASTRAKAGDHSPLALSNQSPRSR